MRYLLKRSVIVKRKDILNDFPEECQDQIKDVIDYFEGIINEIKEKLSITGIGDLPDIEEAFDIATSTGEDLY